MMDLLLAVLGRGETPPLDRLEPEEWDGLQEVACQHRAAPLLWHHLQERGECANPPDAIRRRLSELHVVDALRADARRLQLAEALSALRARRLPSVVLKGAYLAEHVYPSPALRPMGDVDLLVPAHSFDAAVEVLTCIGYAPPDDGSRAAYRNHRHPPPFTRRGYLTIELHTSIEPCTPPFRLALTEVWRRTRPVQSAG
ncbi:MAG TPA: nucleotidyltransferase family protein, partial [Gemmatimonadaceae bacterium]|nr:nucleotidyltransferase family protein [Gemmatimonadaceae bacterium]